jgi:glycosyltransferase involved in cell wall biosynthesis
VIEVSVVIPARNEAEYVAAALDSVAAQRYPLDWLEVVVAVNGSVDDTVGVVGRWLDLHPGLRMTVLEDPVAGVARAKNAGARAAGGQILVFLDADSRMASNLVAKVVAAASDGMPAGSIAMWADSRDWLDRGFFALIEYGKRLLSIRANMLYCRRDLFIEAGGFDERLHQAEDRDFLVRLQRRGVVVGHLTGSGIATSPRRLHEGPLRLGMVRTFARWSLGHAGIWRERPY